MKRMLLPRCDNPQNGCFPSKSTIASACDIAVSTVSKCIQSLEKRGLIKITHNYQNARKQNNNYEILRQHPVRQTDGEGVTMTLPLSDRRISVKQNNRTPK